MGSRYKGSKSEVRALNTLIKLMRATESLSARLNRFLSQAGLTVSQFGALEALYHLGPLCQSALGEKILKSSGNITMVVDNLEKRRLVNRERGIADRRFVTVRLTEKGEGLIRELFPKHVKTMFSELAALTAGEQEELGRLCKKLGKSCSEREGKEKEGRK
jgi:MarR family 2-MHQ and catechol resistance regulon transcriptional repressor